MRWRRRRRRRRRRLHEHDSRQDTVIALVVPGELRQNVLLRREGASCVCICACAVNENRVHVQFEIIATSNHAHKRHECVHCSMHEHTLGHIAQTATAFQRKSR